MHQHMSRYNAVQPSPKPSVRPALHEMHAASSHVPHPTSRPAAERCGLQQLPGQRPSTDGSMNTAANERTWQTNPSRSRHDLPVTPSSAGHRPCLLPRPGVPGGTNTE